MELIERRYRDTPRGKKRYAKRLTEYISHLVLKGRILEAKHFFHSLYEDKPNHVITIRLGYSLSIASFDSEGVRKFDKLLLDSNTKEAELNWFRLKYYLSVNDRKNCESSCGFLLSTTIKLEYLDAILEACVHQGSYAIVVNSIKYLEKENRALSGSVIQKIKNIALQRFVENLEKIRYGKVSSFKDS